MHTIMISICLYGFLECVLDTCPHTPAHTPLRTHACLTSVNHSDVNPESKESAASLIALSCIQPTFYLE